MPDWPRAPAPDACKAAALSTAPPENPALAAAVKKISGGLASSERALLALPEYADTIAARIALECALAEGARLFTSGANVDAAAVDGLAKSAADAAERLSALERNTREVEKTRLFASAQAALHRELQAFQDLAGRLRKAGPRSVALDPAAARAPEPPAPPPPPPQRRRLADFVDFGMVPRWRVALLGLLLLLFGVSLVRAIYYSAAQIDELDAASAGANVSEVRVAGSSAAVVVHPGWQPAQLPQLLNTLRPLGVTSAVILLDSGAGLGQLDVTSGKLYFASRPDAGHQN